jgi:L-lactate dehydrogenase complex protein LldG
VEREVFLARLRERHAAGAVMGVAAAGESAGLGLAPGTGHESAEREAAGQPAAAGPAATVPSVRDLTALFVQRLGELGAVAAVVATRQAAREALESLLAARGWQSVACAPGLVWEGIAARWNAEAREAQLGLCEADWAVAETGAVVVCASAEVRRGYSLVPPAAAFFVPASRIVAGLGDVLRALPRDGLALPSCVSFVSGPSGTSDLAATHVVGVHGPGEVFVWVLAAE